ncbi:MAG: heparinase II/III domain-containing protein [Chthonomonadales bacterium]
MHLHAFFLITIASVAAAGGFDAAHAVPRAHIHTAPMLHTAQAPRVPRDPLRRLHPGHPRIILTDEGLQNLQRTINADDAAREMLRAIRTRGERILHERPVRYVLEGPRLLTQSRLCLERVYTLALLYRLDGRSQWLERAKQELKAAAGFKDWHPIHFLDTAEMTHAVAIGYDWLYPALTAEEREVIRQAIVQKGLRPGLQAYEGKAPWKWWTTVSHNWNQVCNGGMIVGALAVAEDEPVLARTILTNALASLPKALASYAPDGGWVEGPGYWSYATEYTVVLLAAMDTALGTDFGLSRAKGFDRTGGFRIHFVGPTGRTFNYADAHDGAGSDPWMHWLGERFHQPVYHWEAAASAGNHPTALDLVWYRKPVVSVAAAHVPLDALYKGVNVAFFRTAWEDNNALFVGFKGGDNEANHAHLDLGTFVLDALGKRWALDLGSDNYNLPGYFSAKERWTYYRLSTPGHNTLTLDEQNQNVRAVAPIIAYRTSRSSGMAVADLTEGYVPKATRVWRGIQVLKKRHEVLIEDEIDAADAVQIGWTMHTTASISLRGAEAVLRQQGKMLAARILSPQGALFTVAPADAPPPQSPNEGVVRLMIRLPSASGRTRIAVVLQPGAERAAPIPVRPLAEWIRGAEGNAPPWHDPATPPRIHD